MATSATELVSATVLWPIIKIFIQSLVGWYLTTSIWAAVYNLYFHPLAKYPGPALRAAFHFPDARSILSGKAYLHTRNLHEKYGGVVRMSPDTLSYNTAQAWKDIYALKPDRTELAKDLKFYNLEPNILSVGQSDHARIRRLYAHAFTDTALLEQAPLLTGYFELLISKLKRRINGPEQGRVDLTAYYNFTTFDIIGYSAFLNLRLANGSEILGRDLTLGEPFGALTNDENVVESLRFMGILRSAGTYPAIALAFKVFKVIMPSFEAKHVAHLEFTGAKIKKRLDLKTDRRDFMAYARSHSPHACPTIHLLIPAGTPAQRRTRNDSR
ncbi:MAG: hypothetical protein Q9197_003521 [Variospora fuerteventurae]